MSFSLLMLLFSTCLTFCMIECAPMTDMDMMDFLKKYGYTGEKELSEMTKADTIKALEDFQEFNALPVTGKMDEETRNMMERPRCGRPDKGLLPDEFAANSFRDFKWRNRHVTYKFRNYPRNNYGERNAVRETQRAFNVWSNAANITFSQIAQGKADIDIYFPESNKGDGNGRTLAYAYYPERGDIYFDAEDWTLMGRRGINYFQVATHEIGHSLGLSHQENIPQAVMAPFYHGYLPNYMLHQNDIQRIQGKYGPNRMQATGNTFCQAMRLDAVFASDRSTRYVLNNNNVWKYVNQKLANGYPKTLQQEWPGLPMNIDSAYYFRNKFYFFKDQKGFVYDGSMRNFNFPENIPRKIDAAVVINNSLYMFIGNQYWKFRTQPRLTLETGYPKLISSFWTGVPDSIDTVYFNQYRSLFFFKNRKMYIFDFRTRLATGQDISNWFPCKS